MRTLLMTCLLATLTSCGILFPVDETQTFRVIVNPETVTLSQGSNGNVAVTLGYMAGGLGGPSAYQVTGLPPGVTASFGSQPPSENTTSTLTLAIAPSVPVGTYQLVVRTDRDVDEGADLTLAVTAGLP